MFLEDKHLVPTADSRRLLPNWSFLQGFDQLSPFCGASLGWLLCRGKLSPRVPSGGVLLSGEVQLAHLGSSPLFSPAPSKHSGFSDNVTVSLVSGILPQFTGRPVRTGQPFCTDPNLLYGDSSQSIPEQNFRGVRADDGAGKRYRLPG